MAISDELSGDIATALLVAKQKSGKELDDLKAIVLLVHDTLQQMTEEERHARHVSIHMREEQRAKVSH